MSVVPREVRPVRVGIIDSGVHLAHPHIGNISGGVAIGGDAQGANYADRLGHGTAIAALIHQRAPLADLFAVKVFHHALATDLATLLFAIDWCLDNGMDLINLSLGTTNAAHRPAFEMAIARVQATGAAIVSAAEIDGVAALPGTLPGVIAVVADAGKEPGEFGVEMRGGREVIAACPWAREIPGVARERNLHGISFAVAHVTARLAEMRGPAGGEEVANWKLALNGLTPTRFAAAGRAANL